MKINNLIYTLPAILLFNWSFAQDVDYYAPCSDADLTMYQPLDHNLNGVYYSKEDFYIGKLDKSVGEVFDFTNSKVVFKGKNGKKKFSCKEIYGFVSHGEVYVAKRMDDFPTLFYRLLISGSLALYADYLTEINYNSDNSFYMKFNSVGYYVGALYLSRTDTGMIKVARINYDTLSGFVEDEESVLNSLIGIERRQTVKRDMDPDKIAEVASNTISVVLEYNEIKKHPFFKVEIPFHCVIKDSNGENIVKKWKRKPAFSGGF